MSGSLHLRPLVEVVHEERRLWLLRGPGGGDCRITDPPDAVRALVDLLDGDGGTPAELRGALAARGLAVDRQELGEMLEALASADLLEQGGEGDDEARLSRQLLYLRDRRAREADPVEMQHRVREASVAIVGCGGLGSWAAAGLACIGVGSLTLVDGDVVERSNLNRQLLFRERDIGRSKVAAAAESLRAFDASIAVRAVEHFVTGVEDARRCVAGHDFVVACADQPAYEIARWLDAACRLERVPHISAGQLPPIVRVGPTVLPGQTACVRCLETALRAANPLYDRLEALRRAARRPLATVGPASGIAGQVIAMEVLHHLTGLVRPATAGAIWTIDLRTLESELTPVAQVGDCLCHVI